MESSGRSGNDNWRRPSEPPAFARWVAGHRVLTRVILIGLDLALLTLLVTGLISGDNHWSPYLQLPVYGWLTWHIGWITPKSVDDWRTARRLRSSRSEEQTSHDDRH